MTKLCLWDRKVVIVVLTVKPVNESSVIHFQGACSLVASLPMLKR